MVQDAEKFASIDQILSNQIPNPIISNSTFTSNNNKNNNIDSNSNVLINLTSIQLANGSWQLNEEFCNTINKELSDFSGKIPIGTKEDIFATVLALTILEVLCYHLQEDWNLLAQKAKEWLTLQIYDKIAVQSIADQFVKQNLQNSGDSTISYNMPQRISIEEVD